jgi:hypothetical protein
MRSIHLRTAAAITLLMGFTSAHANDSQLQGVPDANPKLPGVSSPDILSPQLRQSAVAEGSMRVENPSGLFEFYGFSGDGPHTPAPGALPAPGSLVEATRTEPDKNTYLVLFNQHGADSGYRYGKHFLFQGHENSAGGNGYITRINLDADGDHRVTVLASTDSKGASLPLIDGSTWYPWSGRLLFTSEGNGTSSGGLWQATPDFPSSVDDLLGIMGRGGFEGVQADADGNLWIVEDIGGATVAGARVANSFLYRFIPKSKRNLAAGGKLQALQVMKLDHSGPIVFNPANALTQDAKDLHTYGNVFDTKWITIHDTDIDGTAVFNANALAKAKSATPFKRPENGQFRPGTGFRQFFFDETGDTSAASTANNSFGGFGSVMKLTQFDPSASAGKLTLLFNCDLTHASFDNVAFWDANHLVFVEDRGDGLHAQANALDSAWMFDVRKDYSNPINQPVRILAEGRDALATIDSGFLGLPGFQNDGDNEITGIHISNGDPGVDGLLGAQFPRPFRDGWRVFYTQQHGENVTWEILPSNMFDADDRW